MVITKTPLRIPIAGGGTDLPDWYKDNGSMFISATIDKFIYVTYHRSDYDKRIRLRYSKMEEVEKVEDIKHDIIKATLKYSGVKDRLELTSHAEIPDGTGLGSSGAFGVGILNAIKGGTKEELAQQSTMIQMDLLKHPIGQQDQWASAMGGLNMFKVSKKGSVEVKPFKRGIAERLQNKLVIFYTGVRRDANRILRSSTLEGLDAIQDLAWGVKNALEEDKFDEIGEMMNTHWEFKKRRGQMTSPEIDKWYDYALENGALGGKLIGAGGGGFLLFYTNNPEQLISAMTDDDNSMQYKGLQHQQFKFEFEGTTIL